MNYGKVEERSSSRSRSPNTARRAATSAILTDILSRSDRAPNSRTADARPGKSILIVPSESSANTEIGRNGLPGKEQSQMTNEKVIMLIEAKIQPQRRAELVEAGRQYLPLVRAEPGVEAFYLTVR